MTAIRLIARPMLASMFVVGGIDSLLNASPKVSKAERVTEHVPTLAEKIAPGLPVPTDPATLIRINGGAQVAAGLALATGRMPRLSALVLAASLVPTTYAGHAFWEEKDKSARAMQRIQFFKNISMMGGLLVAGVDTEGKPGMAWRARRAAKDVRREAKTLAKQARAEARIAKAHLT
ncbi:MAG TPA: DoxX family protein [Nocardioides sp.]|uniref:DoxX family protein n=1 Tax=Nocardioides sp. TaxID=35761 RepID=UPI002F3E253E